MQRAVQQCAIDGQLQRLMRRASGLGRRASHIKGPVRVLAFYLGTQSAQNTRNHSSLPVPAAASSIAGSCASAKGPAEPGSTVQRQGCLSGERRGAWRERARAATVQRRCPEMQHSRQPRRQRCSTTRAASTAAPRAPTTAGSAPRTTSRSASSAPACTARWERASVSCGRSGSTGATRHPTTPHSPHFLRRRACHGATGSPRVACRATTRPSPISGAVGATRRPSSAPSNRRRRIS